MAMGSGSGYTSHATHRRRIIIFPVVVDVGGISLRCQRRQFDSCHCSTVQLFSFRLNVDMVIELLCRGRETEYEEECERRTARTITQHCTKNFSRRFFPISFFKAMCFCYLSILTWHGSVGLISSCAIRPCTVQLMSTALLIDAINFCKMFDRIWYKNQYPRQVQCGLFSVPLLLVHRIVVVVAILFVSFRMFCCWWWWAWLWTMNWQKKWKEHTPNKTENAANNRFSMLTSCFSIFPSLRRTYVIEIRPTPLMVRHRYMVLANYSKMGT